MKRLSGLLLVLLLAGCGGAAPGTDNGSGDEVVEKLQIVTSFYPLYEIAQQVGGDLVEVRNLVPPGTEPHDYEPTPQDIVAMREADLLIYNGAGLEAWVDKVMPQLEEAGVMMLNESAFFVLLERQHEEEEHVEEEEEEEHGPLDPHIWLDPLLYVEEVRAVSAKFSELDAAHAHDYQQNSSAFIAYLFDLDRSYREGLASCKHRSFVTNHAAFGYLAQRYGLEMVPIAGISPDEEPSPRALALLADFIQEQGIQYVLVESLGSPKLAETLANETGAQTLLLNPLESLAPEELQAGENYVSVMRENLENLKIALECEVAETKVAE